MKYELLNTIISAEMPIVDSDEYAVVITLRLHPTDNIASDFSKDIIVVSNNSQTGFEVDEIRQIAINDFLTLINQ